MAVEQFFVLFSVNVGVSLTRDISLQQWFRAQQTCEAGIHSDMGEMGDRCYKCDFATNVCKNMAWRMTRTR